MTRPSAPRRATAALRWAIVGTILVATMAAPASLRAQAPTGPATITFDPPTADGSFGDPVTFRTRFEADEPPERVELVTRLPGERVRQVTIASVRPLAAGAWEATVVLDGQIVPNTLFDYHFRAVTETGDVVGPEAEHRVTDDRVEWREVERDGVRLWWSEGDDAFAERALSIAEGALASASELLGVEQGEPVDVFIYGDTATFRSAMGPGTRENVGGQAHPSIRTLFGLIQPSQIGSDWVEELVRHELTHLVFDDAVRSPFAYPPRWLNEGVAVHLSRGLEESDRAQVEAAVRGGTIIPLEGLDGQFPTRARRFSLAYAESASAVTYLVADVRRPRHPLAPGGLRRRARHRRCLPSGPRRRPRRVRGRLVGVGRVGRHRADRPTTRAARTGTCGLAKQPRPSDTLIHPCPTLWSAPSTRLPRTGRPTPMSASSGAAHSTWT